MRIVILSLFCLSSAFAGSAVRPNDLVGDWMILRECGEGVQRLQADSRYFGSCFDTIEEGRWLLSSSDKLVLYYGPKKSDRRTLTILKVEALPDRTFLTVRYSDGTIQKWMR